MAKKGKKNRTANRRAAYQQAAALPKSKAINPVVIGIVTVAMVIVLAAGYLGSFGITGAPVVAGSNSAPAAGGSVSAAQQQTINSLQNTLKTDAKNLGVLIELGNTFYDTKQYSQAVDPYTQALDIDPNNTNVRVDLGTAYLNLGMTSQAIDNYKKALEIDPNKPQAHFNLGNALISQSSPDTNGAIAEWKLAIQDANGDQSIIKSAQSLIDQYQGK